MPELPEVETIVRELRPLLLGRRIVALKVGKKTLRRKWRRQWQKEMLGRRIVEVQRRGKWIVFSLQGDRYLLFHLGMTGQLQVMPSVQPRAEHTHVILDLGGRARQEQLRFRDVRRFGSVTLFCGREECHHFFQHAKLGPEPFVLDASYWRRRLAGTRRCLKALLLDQRTVAGVGNIYADEALFEARLHPARLGQELSAAEAGRLQKAVVTVLNRAIQRRGSSIRDYVGGNGQQGGYQLEFRVYGRVGESCPRCRQVIQRIRLAGRSTHFCPKCQR